MSRHELDARGMLGPLPVIRLEDFVATLSCGDVLQVICTDPGALNDMPAWCRLNGHRVPGTREVARQVFVPIPVAQA